MRRMSIAGQLASLDEYWASELCFKMVSGDGNVTWVRGSWRLSFKVECCSTDDGCDLVVLLKAVFVGHDVRACLLCISCYICWYIPLSCFWRLYFSRRSVYRVNSLLVACFVVLVVIGFIMQCKHWVRMIEHQHPR